ncbi:dihydropteroate synthase [Bacteroidota bacterium]|nr:dihydropteroate synthase [Bacteroidota bacterium]
MRTLNCNGKLFVLEDPIVMGILNTTPDSFFDGGKFFSEKEIFAHAEKMIADGATIIDVGGQSTRPKAEPISVEEELKRVIPVIKLIHNKFPDQLISIDTFYSEVAVNAVESGASIINDVSGGCIDEKMFSIAAKLHVPYILMHMQGTPETMQQNPDYGSVVKEVKEFFKQKIPLLRDAGVNDIILDVGFGFGKNTEHNYSLLKHLKDFNIFELPMLVGFSRKSMINRMLKTTPEDALNGTTVLNTIALMNGASILRVHDVKEAMQAIILFKKYHAAD